MGSRLLQSQIFRDLLGSNNVYFQPPVGTEMKYPCIKYELETITSLFASNKPLLRFKRYSVMVIDANPDSLIPDKIGSLPLSRFDRFYTANNLNHWVYNLYF